MYLSDKKTEVPRKLDDHEELEVLLESFAKQVEEIVNEAENIQVSCEPDIKRAVYGSLLFHVQPTLVLIHGTLAVVSEGAARFLRLRGGLCVCVNDCDPCLQHTYAMFRSRG